MSARALMLYLKGILPPPGSRSHEGRSNRRIIEKYEIKMEALYIQKI
jgi:hypothetical protein